MINKNYEKYIIKLVLLWLGSCVFPALFYVAVVLPQRDELRHTNRILAQKEEQYGRFSDSQEAQTRAKIDEKLKKRRGHYDDFIAAYGDSGSLVFAVSEIASEQEITSFSARQLANEPMTGKVKYEQIKENRINVTFESDFAAFARFVNTLERQRPIVFVDRFTVSKQQDEDARLKASMELAVFAMKERDASI